MRRLLSFTTLTATRSFIICQTDRALVQHLLSLSPGKNSDPPTRNILISFGIDGKEGLCDPRWQNFDACKIPIPYIFRQQCRQSRMVKNFQDELIVKLDGTVVAELKHNGDSQDVRASMMGGATFSEGRRSVDHGFASPCALMDLSGKVNYRLQIF